MSADARDWLARGNAYARDGQPAAAAEAYRETLAREPDWHDARFNLGLMQKQLGDRASAIRAFHAAWVGRSAAVRGRAAMRRDDRRLGAGRRAH